jgi:uncharacterized protein YcfL
MFKTFVFFILIISLLLIVGCSTNRGNFTSETVETASEQKLIVPEGTAEFLWEEPQVSIVEVSPGLDEQGIYYNPKHYSISPVKQGRWRYFRRN